LQFIKRETDRIIVKNDILNRVEEYETLAQFPFDSDRKRMSLIVKHKGKYLLLSKGADTMMLKRINFINEEEKKTIEKDLLRFSSDGLRTLVIAQK
jgi:magnesium-transporting ATPase (P-type)